MGSPKAERVLSVLSSCIFSHLHRALLPPLSLPTYLPTYHHDSTASCGLGSGGLGLGGTTDGGEGEEVWGRIQGHSELHITSVSQVRR